MRGKSLSRLLALLLAALPGPIWAARVALPPAVVSGLRTMAPLALPVGVGPSPAALSLGPASSLSVVPALSAPEFEPAPAVTAAAAPQVSPLAVLTRAAAPEASAAHAAAVFDGSSYGLDGVQRKWGKLYQGGRELEALGEGSFGRVYVHPGDQGVIVKLMTSLSGDIARQTARQDGQVGLKLAQAGVGPAVLGVTDIPGRPSLLRRWLGRLFGLAARPPPRPAVVKERVYGGSLDDLIARREFTQEDYDLVMEMLGRMADARLKAGDLRPANVMIGRTASDPRRRAYLVDGGWLLPVPAGQGREELLQSLRTHQAELLGAGGSAGWANVQDPFDDILRDGLRTSRR